MCVYVILLCFSLFFFFKQKTAYEMRISDWSSDTTVFDDERRAWNSPQSGNGERLSFTKPKPRPANTSATIVPGKKHIPTPGFKADDPSLIQAGMEVEHEKFGFGTIETMEGRLTYDNIGREHV